MNDPTLNLLDRLDQTSVPPLPLDAVLTHARSANRKRRRVMVAGTVAATALIIGGGAAVLHGVALPAERDASPATSRFAAGALRVDVDYRVPDFAAVPIGEPVQSGIRAQWDPARMTLTYVSADGYSSTCTPAATAEISADGAVDLVIRENPGEPGKVCTADAARIAAVIHGIAAPPQALQVTERGRSEDVSIAHAPGGSGITSTPASDGPVVAHPESGDGVGMQALIQGTLSLSHGCLLVGGYPVIWPHGTTWDAQSETVELPDGQVVAAGDRVRGGGGYPYLSDLRTDLAKPLAHCPTNKWGEIAAFNAGERITVLN